MKAMPLQIGESILKTDAGTATGQFIDIDRERFYKISNYDCMPPFLMSIVSDSDHWMFLSSRGGITAGRRDPDNALFPYETDDKIYDAAEKSGSATCMRVARAGGSYLWEPFSARYAGLYRIKRNLYKNGLGNRVLFEEINADLALTFHYGWMNSEKFGFVKTSRIINSSPESVTIELLDGLLNILPFGITRRFQMEYSTLGDAYKKSESAPGTTVAIYSLSSIPTDKAEPSEALKATTVFSVGLEQGRVLLSQRQLDDFRRGRAIESEDEIRGQRGAYLLHATIGLAGRSERDWLFACDVAQDSADVIRIVNMQQQRNLKMQVLEDVSVGCANLTKILANADGLQCSRLTTHSARHLSNVLFNVMRGGIFEENYVISKSDFLSYLERTNRAVLEKHRQFLQRLPDKLIHSNLKERIEPLGEKDLTRLYFCYLPLTFSRRHGDPSRPWNLFSIEIKNSSGERILNYQGNWRDIFQNWEALLLSFPEYIESAVSKFLNASTADGYNPYRITREGFDWEVLDPHDPWSYIGYWGDHQVIYLQRLLELSQRYHPEVLESFLTREMFAFANVPYRIKPYADIVKNPHSTIDFDGALHADIERRVKALGSDGRLVVTRDGAVFHVNLTEKLLITLLVRLSNFIPGAGIWMNTQRPEWNDANNALVGFGVSMVTLYYLRRLLNFCAELFRASQAESAAISEETAAFFHAISHAMQQRLHLLRQPLSDANRKMILDELGEAGSAYRWRIYDQGFSGKKNPITFETLNSFCDLALQHIDSAIAQNKREDSLYNAYNLMKVENRNAISIRRLYEMLEGQVAILSAGVLSAGDALTVLESLRDSALYRADQHSYILYPNRRLPRFLEKNRIPAAEFEKSELLRELVAQGDCQIVAPDVEGAVHFNGAMRNARVLEQALDKLPHRALVTKEKELILKMYETVFDHQSFTGRSGTFFKYEGLGSIYWHMVSKLLVAIQENIFHALEQNEDRAIIDRLIHFYRDVQQGIGATKSPAEYGAFPTDPYSHTPAHAGVQQPGMTGQVKEDILTRFGELGIIVQAGKIHFQPILLNEEEFLVEPADFTYYDVAGERQVLPLKSGSLGFTYCQVPVIYSMADRNEVILTDIDGMETRLAGLVLDAQQSASMFRREGRIRRIDIHIRKA
ncbi:MAG: hypothetical protein ACOY90_21675 [Candidatus Zhuqueibacterota bacterium]